MNDLIEPNATTTGNPKASTQLDYPLVRNLSYCPLCFNHKGQGQVACWSCYVKYNLRDGNPQIEMFLYKVDQAHRAHERNAKSANYLYELNRESPKSAHEINTESPNGSHKTSNGSSQQSYNEQPDYERNDNPGGSFIGPSAVTDEFSVSPSGPKT